MIGQKKITTKERILSSAARLFSERGYDRVTVREIAKDVGINSSSLYNHFVSKEEILKSLYNYYSERMREGYPDLQELLKLAETEPPLEVLMKTEFHFNDNIRDFLDKILITAARMICDDTENENFIRDNIFDSISNTLKPLLEKMVELGKIKPFDIDTFIRVMTYFCFSAAALNNSPFMQSVAEYQAGMALIFSMIDPIEE